MNTDLHFSSATCEWATPPDFFDRLHRQFQFETDVCAGPDNAKCPRYFSREQDGLKQTWTGSCWMNPPYGREIGKWVEKAYVSACHNQATVVCLIPSRTDTRWWHDYVMRASEIRLVRGRLKFVGRSLRCDKCGDKNSKVLNRVQGAHCAKVCGGYLALGPCEEVAPFPSAVVIFRPETSTQGLFKSMRA